MPAGTDVHGAVSVPIADDAHWKARAPARHLLVGRAGDP
jgi:hypothetical protein